MAAMSASVASPAISGSFAFRPMARSSVAIGRSGTSGSSRGSKNLRVPCQVRKTPRLLRSIAAPRSRRTTPERPATPRLGSATGRRQTNASNGTRLSAGQASTSRPRERLARDRSGAAARERGAEPTRSHRCDTTPHALRPDPARDAAPRRPGHPPRATGPALRLTTQAAADRPRSFHRRRPGRGESPPRLSLTPGCEH